MHPQGDWAGGQAMHRTQELRMGKAWSPAGKGGGRDADTERQTDTEEEWAELPPIPWAQGHAGATVPSVS